ILRTPSKFRLVVWFASGYGLVHPPRSASRRVLCVDACAGQGVGPYTKDIKKAEDDIKAATKKVKELAGIKESDTGLGPPSLWDLAADKQMMQEEQALQVARCTKIINPGTEDAKYVINIKQVCPASLDAACHQIRPPV
ncbi:hypothetical protein N9K45_00005, partial [bacterium]|nr:hypothetical protein [bacterium]